MSRSNPRLEHDADVTTTDEPGAWPPRGDHPIARQMKAQHQEFCECYALHGVAARAAREAGYSEKNSAHQGVRLLRNRKIRAYIRDLRRDIGYREDWEMMDASVRLEFIYDVAIMDSNYHAAIRAVEAQMKIKTGTLNRLNAAALRLLDEGRVAEQESHMSGKDFLRRDLQAKPGQDSLAPEAAPEPMPCPPAKKGRKQ